MDGRREEAVSVASTLHIFSPFMPFAHSPYCAFCPGCLNLDTFFLFFYFLFHSYESVRGGVAILRSTQSRTVGLLVVTRCQIKHLQIMTRFSGINAVLVFSVDGGPLCGGDFHVMAMTPEDSAERGRKKRKHDNDIKLNIPCQSNGENCSSVGMTCD